MKSRFISLASLTVFVALAVSLAIAQSGGQVQAQVQAKKNSTATSPPAASRSTATENSATEPADQPVATLSVQVKVVNVLATVRDKHGKIVNGLSKDDFTLTEDGRPQTIHYFTRETDIPLTLGCWWTPV